MIRAAQVTTYDVVPVTPVLGILAFVPNTEPLLKLLEHGQPAGALDETAKQHFQDIHSISNPKKDVSLRQESTLEAIRFLQTANLGCGCQEAALSGSCYACSHSLMYWICNESYNHVFCRALIKAVVLIDSEIQG